MYVSAADDYKVTDEMLTFSSKRISHVISVTIVDDKVVEEAEQLLSMLQSESSEVNIELTPSVSMVTIVDDDSKQKYICIANSRKL